MTSPFFTKKTEAFVFLQWKRDLENHLHSFTSKKCQPTSMENIISHLDLKRRKIISSLTTDMIFILVNQLRNIILRNSSFQI